MNKILQCEHACQADTYPAVMVRTDAARNVENSQRFLTQAWEGGDIVADEWVPAHKQAGCLFKVFNDGGELPTERSNRGILDITCVGPTNDRCPKKRGFKFVKILSKGINTEVPRT